MSQTDLFIPTTVSAKRGDLQPVVLAIRTATDCPTIASSWGREWQGLGTANPSSYHNADGVRLPLSWRVRLLHRDPRTEQPARDHAAHGDDYGHRGNPALTFRGQTLPDVVADVRVVVDSNGPRHVVYWQGALATSTRQWLADQLDAAIVEAIKANGPRLKAAAISYLAGAFQEGVQRLRADADKREQEAARILAALEARKD